ncbi:MAG TPA: hypothetical protein VJ300_05710 [Thermoplasmata archaeon]|nr:hypothetical protein [Thermoplasmata archaeon]
MLGFSALTVGVFLALALASVVHRTVISPAALGALFLLLAIVFAETALTLVGNSTG